MRCSCSECQAWEWEMETSLAWRPERMKFFKHSGPLPNPTRTDNHDNSDNVAPRSRPSSVHTHHQSDRPTAQDSQRRGPRSPISIAAGDTPSAKLPGISAAPPLYAARGAAKA